MRGPGNIEHIKNIPARQEAAHPRTRLSTGASPAPRPEAIPPAPQSSPATLFAEGQRQVREGNLVEAARLYRLATDGGYAAAQTSLGYLYRLSLGGLPKDEREAARLYRLAADQGFAAAQTNLGQLYEQGLGGLARDVNEAVRLYRLAARAGNTSAQQQLTRLGQSW